MLYHARHSSKPCLVGATAHKPSGIITVTVARPTKANFSFTLVELGANLEVLLIIIYFNIPCLVIATGVTSREVDWIAVLGLVVVLRVSIGIGRVLQSTQALTSDSRK